MEMGFVGHRHRKGSADMTGRKLAQRALEESVEKVQVPVAVRPNDGSVPLEDGRRESYCQKICAGMEPVEAWCLAFRDEVGRERGSKKQARTYKCRVEKEEKVIKRVEWLVNNGETKTTVTKKERMSSMDALWRKTRDKAMRDDASANDVKAFLEVAARLDLITGMTSKPKMEVVFPQLDALFSSASVKETKKELGIEAEVLEEKEDGGKRE